MEGSCERMQHQVSTCINSDIVKRPLPKPLYRTTVFPNGVLPQCLISEAFGAKPRRPSLRTVCVV